MMTRRRLLATAAALPVPVLMSQSDPVQEFINVGNEVLGMYYNNVNPSSREQLMAAMPRAAEAFRKMGRSLSSETRDQITGFVRSPQVWISTIQPNYQAMQILTSRGLVSLGCAQTITPVFQAMPLAYEFQTDASSVFDSLGIEGWFDNASFFFEPGKRPATVQTAPCVAETPPVKAWFAALAVVISGLAFATLLGCVQCGPVAAAIAIGLAISKLYVELDCAFRY